LKKGLYGYLRDDHLGIYCFVSNNNLAVRRTVALRAGGYRDELRVAEDFDLCQRVAAAGGLLYFCPEVSLEHRARGTVRGLLRQWWSYGFHLARNHWRFHSGRIFLVARPPHWDDAEAGEPVHSASARRTPLSRPTVLLYLSPFALMHFAIAMSALALVLEAENVAAVGAAVGLLAACASALPDFRHFKIDGAGAAVGLCGLRYLVNLVFVGGGFAGGLTRGSLYLLPPIATRIGPMRRPVDGAR
jgi:GT2 family glycosyltransferase